MVYEWAEENLMEVIEENFEQMTHETVNNIRVTRNRGLTGKENDTE